MQKLSIVLMLAMVWFIETADAQTTKSRPHVDANKKWELLHDATGQVLASCDASLKCEVSDELKRMIVCHDQMQRALRALDNQKLMEPAELQWIMQECVTAWTDR